MATNVHYPVIQTAGTSTTVFTLGSTVPNVWSTYDPGYAAHQHKQAIAREYNKLRKNSKQERNIRLRAKMLAPAEEAVKHIRCMHGGVPSETFDILLRASREPQPIPLVQGIRLGGDKKINMINPNFANLMNTGLLKQVISDRPYVVYRPKGGSTELERVEGKSRKTKFDITLRGLELLEAAAIINRDFKRFYDAYLPKSYLTKVKARLVKEVMIPEKV